MDQQNPRAPKLKLTVTQWIAAGVLAFIMLIAVASGGVGGLLIMAGLMAAAFAGYSVLRARASWLRFGSRKVAAAALTGSLVVLMVGGGVYGATHPKKAVEQSASPGRDRAVPQPKPTENPKPEFEFTDESPEDPAIVTVPDEEAQTVADSSATTGTALALLETLPVKGRAPKTGYDRSLQFGNGWLDVDRNGCDTHNDMLARDRR